MEVVQLDDPLEAALQVAILFEHPLILLADALLDSGDLVAGRTVGFRNSGGAGCCRCVGPVLEDRQGPLQLPHGADDGHDLDGSAPGALGTELQAGRDLACRTLGNSLNREAPVRWAHVMKNLRPEAQAHIAARR